MVITTLLTSLPHETLHESWLKNLTPPHCPHCPKKQKGWLPGVSLPGSKPHGPCRTIITDPRLARQGAHNLAGVGVSPGQLPPRPEGRRVTAADFLVGTGMGEDHKANQAQGGCPVKSPGPARILPSQTQACLLPESLVLLIVKDECSLRPLC